MDPFFEVRNALIVVSALLLFLIPQFIFMRNRNLYTRLKREREESNQTLMESFRGRIEISKYNLEEKAIQLQKHGVNRIEGLEKSLQANSFSLQMIIGFGLSCVAIFILWQSSRHDIDAALAIGIFFGIMAQAELAEMLFSGKSERSSVANQVGDLDILLKTDMRAPSDNVSKGRLEHLESALALLAACAGRRRH